MLVVEMTDRGSDYIAKIFSNGVFRGFEAARTWAETMRAVDRILPTMGLSGEYTVTNGDPSDHHHAVEAYRLGAVLGTGMVSMP